MTNTPASDQILIQDSLGRVRTSPERRAILLEEYERSGMTAMGFAEQVGMKYTTLAHWVQKKRKRLQIQPKAVELENPPLQWVEAVVAARADVEEKGSGLQIRLMGGAVMEITDARGADFAAQILRHLGETPRC